METSSYVGKNVSALFACGGFIYHVDGILESTDESILTKESELQFKNATLSASGTMFGDIKPTHNTNTIYGAAIVSDLREINKGKRLSMDKKDLVAIMELESE